MLTPFLLTGLAFKTRGVTMWPWLRPTAIPDLGWAIKTSGQVATPVRDFISPFNPGRINAAIVFGGADTVFVKVKSPFMLWAYQSIAFDSGLLITTIIIREIALVRLIDLPLCGDRIDLFQILPHGQS